MSRKMHRHTRRPASRVVKSESRAHKLHEQNRARLVTLIAFLGLCFVGLALRLVEVSLIGGGELPFKRLVSEPQLLLRMEDETGATHLTPATDMAMVRRSIVDRNGMLLAANLPTACLAANPSLIREPARTARLLASVLGDVHADALQQKLSREGSRFTYVKRQLTPAEQQAVHRLGIPGLFFQSGMRRVYPAGELTAHVLGFVDIDNHGLAGMERYFDKRLHYAHGEREPLTVSLDLRVQALVAEELQAAIDTFSARGAAGVVADVRSGEILAMVSLPSFDPHRAGEAEPAARFNRIALGVYELGSVFKTFTLALGLEKGIISPRDGYDTSQPIHEAGYPIRDYKPYYRWLSVPEIFAYSSNIGTVKIAQDTGYRAQRQFIEKLGLTEPLQIELPERATPLVPKTWQPLNHMTISYGHGISVSPLHLVRAMSAMVNGGILPKLTLLKQPPKKEPEGERVIRPQTSRQVREMMRLVVDYGTARQAQVAGYAVGGKTGTAEKSIGGRYDDDKKLTSFVSAFPIDNPRYVIFIMVDEPKGTKATFGYATGGWVAAPVSARIIRRMGPMLGVPPVFREPDAREEAFWEASRRRNKEAREAWHRRQQGGVRAATY